jgi:hypothetical protein
MTVPTIRRSPGGARESTRGMTGHFDTPVIYEGRSAVLATKHDKLSLITPPLAATGLIVVAVAVDTDQLGTFSGEVSRPAAPLDTAIARHDSRWP